MARSGDGKDAAGSQEPRSALASAFSEEAPQPGPANGLMDIPGLSVGHAEAEPPARSGVTVIRCAGLWPASVDVRGGGPATRETDLLAPSATVAAAHALVLSGGSVFGLAAADAVVRRLSAEGVGLQPSPGDPPVPIAPAACLYDLPLSAPGAAPPPDYGALAEGALANAASRASESAVGSIGAGRGARAGLHPGGLGEASLVWPSGLRVAALVAINPVGSPYRDGDPSTGVFWAWDLERRWRGAPEFGGARPDPARAAPSAPFPPDAKFQVSADLGAGPAGPQLNTMLAAVATSAPLDAPALHRVAIMAQDGFARAVRPAHTSFDGDTVFALAPPAAAGSQAGVSSSPALVSLIGAAAADCVARAICRGVHAARGGG
ncbi:MAG: P1 family peptidase [Pseudomonadota bacterium]